MALDEDWFYDILNLDLLVTAVLSCMVFSFTITIHKMHPQKTLSWCFQHIQNFLHRKNNAPGVILTYLLYAMSHVPYKLNYSGRYF